MSKVNLGTFNMEQLIMMSLKLIIDKLGQIHDVYDIFEDFTILT